MSWKRTDNDKAVEYMMYKVFKNFEDQGLTGSWKYFIFKIVQ